MNNGRTFWVISERPQRYELSDYLPRPFGIEASILCTHKKDLFTVTRPNLRFIPPFRSLTFFSHCGKKYSTVKNAPRCTNTRSLTIKNRRGTIKKEKKMLLRPILIFGDVTVNTPIFLLTSSLAYILYTIVNIHLISFRAILIINVHTTTFSWWCNILKYVA